MIDITEFNPDLHLTLVLIAAVFTLMCVHVLRYVLSGRNRAAELEEIIEGIHKVGESRKEDFRKDIEGTADLIDKINAEVSSGYDEVVIKDLTEHEIRTIKAAQDSQRRRDKISSCLSNSDEIDKNITSKIPRNNETLQEVNASLMKIGPAISEFHNTIMMMREEKERNESLNEALNRIENIQASTERSLMPIHQRYKR